MRHDPRTWDLLDRPTDRPTDRDDISISLDFSLVCAGSHDTHKTPVTTRHDPHAKRRTRRGRVDATRMDRMCRHEPMGWIGLDWTASTVRRETHARGSARNARANTYTLDRQPHEGHGRDADASARHRHVLSRESGDGCRRVRASVRAGRDVGVHRTARAEGCEGGERGDSSGRTSSDDGEHDRGVFEFHGARRRRADALDATRRDSTRTRD